MERVRSVSLATIAGTVFGFCLILGAIAHGTENYWSFLSLEGFLIVIGGTVAAALSGFIIGGLARVFVANQAAWCVGSISHMIGWKA